VKGTERSPFLLRSIGRDFLCAARSYLDLFATRIIHRYKIPPQAYTAAGVPTPILFFGVSPDE